MQHLFFPRIHRCCMLLGNTTAVMTSQQLRSVVVLRRKHKPNVEKLRRQFDQDEAYDMFKNKELYMYEVVQELTHKPKFTSIKVLMMENVDGVGLMGEVRDVDIILFRNFLYPGGFATYPTWDKFEELKEKSEHIKSDLQMLYKYSVDTRSLIKKMIGCHLPVPMSPLEQWELNTTHIRVAFRQIGIHVDKESIILPKEPITRPQEFTFDLIMNKEFILTLKGTVYTLPVAVEEGEELEEKEIAKVELPPVWNNKPVRTEATESIIKILFPEHSITEHSLNSSDVTSDKPSDTSTDGFKTSQHPKRSLFPKKSK